MPQQPQAPAWAGQYIFRAELKRVVDGDTLDLDIDVGLHCHRIERVRLLGVNAPEMHGASAAAGQAAKDYVIGWLAGAGELVVQTYKCDVFGRYLAQVWGGSGRCLNDDLLSSANAAVYG